MPKAPVHKDHEILSREKKVRIARQTRSCDLPTFDTGADKGGAQPPFSRAISRASDFGHYF